MSKRKPYHKINPPKKKEIKEPIKIIILPSIINRNISITHQL